jgi:hypothetical protein
MTKKLLTTLATLALVGSGLSSASGSISFGFADTPRTGSLVTNFIGAPSQQDLLVSLSINLPANSFASFGSGNTSLSTSLFELRSNRLSSPVAPSSANYRKSTADSLVVDVNFANIRSSLCQGDVMRLDVLNPVTLPVSDAQNRDLVRGSYTLSFNPGSLASCAPVVSSAQVSAPIKYSGPEFSGLSLKPILNGSSTTIEGRKLDQISSITIDGKAAKLSDATDKSLKLELPAGLKPGVYDLVVNTANHGKLTHMNAIRIREELPATSLTIRGSGVLSGEEFKKLTAFSRTQNPDMNTVTCIVNSSSEGKSFLQARALCDRIAANNLNIKTTMFEARSSVEGSAIFARVVFSSEE